MGKDSIMGTVNTEQFSALGALGYEGSLPNRRKIWNDNMGFKGHMDFYNALVEAGYDGAFPNMEYDFWVDGGIFNLFDNSGFDGNSNGWLIIGTPVWNAGVMSFPDTTPGNMIYQNFAIPEDGTYRCQCDISNPVTGGGLVWVIEDVATAFPAEVDLDIVIHQGAWSLGVAGNGIAGSVDVDNILLYRIA